MWADGQLQSTVMPLFSVSGIHTVFDCLVLNEGM